MLHRQKAIVSILQQVGGEASSLQMMKLAFLLAHETFSQGGKTFYQFIPYRFGPYSFTLSQEKDSLIRNGYLEHNDEKLWTLTQLGKKLNTELPQSIERDICEISRKYGKFSGNELIDLVYKKYDWFTINSDLIKEQRHKRPIASKAIYTAGYEGKTVDEFLNNLLKFGVSRLIDVRYNPVSRRYGFHKSTLARLCGFLEIDYQHIPELGIVGTERCDLHSAAQYKSLFAKYRSSLISKESAVKSAINLLTSSPSVLVCMEADPAFCHRNALAQYLTTLIELPIKHL